MAMTPGYYMPNYYYGAQYPSLNTNPYGQQSYAPAVQPQPNQGMQWVDGEVGAKAFQMPQGWPVGTPIALWDTNDTVIYLKSMNQMGMPNPLQRIHYTMEEQPNQSRLPAGNTSGDTQPQANYATKDDLESMKNELRDLINSQRKQNGGGNQNGSNNGGNRGGNQ